MTATTDCCCWGDPTSPNLWGHETWCPARTGIPWCENCSRTRCVCRPIYIDHSNTPDPWKETA